MKAKERVELELKELVVKHNALQEFVKLGNAGTMIQERSSNFEKLSKIQKELLLEQEYIMRKYRDTLALRLHYWE